MNAARKRIPLSLAAAVALWGVLAVGLLTSPPKNLLSWDTFGYHLYLPATLIHHDPGVRDPAWVDEAMRTYESSGTLYQISQLPNGRWVNKYPMGLAMLWSPFFVAGHAVAGIIGAPQDGFSMPYQWALIIAALVYMLIGMLVLRKVLRVFFSEAVVAITLALIVIGTNYFHQALQGTGMPHIFLFTLGAGVIWHSIRWHAEHRRRDAIVLGVLLGLLVVSRPSEIVWIVVPLLIGLQRAACWRDHLRTLWRWRSHVMIATFLAGLVCLPQLVYWKWMTGQWLYMSYNNPGEGFEFLHPYTWEVLLSFRKGWYIYTPLMLVATLGIFALRRYLPAMRWSIISFFVLNLYVVSSWSCWWYADSFGQRALVQSYALMALPLGALVLWLREQRALVRAAGVTMTLLLVCLNLFQTHQSVHGLIHTSRMTWPAYKAVFGRMDVPPGIDALLLVDHEQTTFNVRPGLARYRAVPLLVVDDTDTLEMPWKRITRADHAWLELRCESAISEPRVLSAAMVHNGYAYHERTATVGDDGDASMWYLTPSIRRPTDLLRIMRRDPRVGVGRIFVTLHEPLVGE